jgi:hypothetical protein
MGDAHSAWSIPIGLIRRVFLLLPVEILYALLLIIVVFFLLRPAEAGPVPVLGTCRQSDRSTEDHAHRQPCKKSHGSYSFSVRKVTPTARPSRSAVSNVRLRSFARNRLMTDCATAVRCDSS